MQCLVLGLHEDEAALGGLVHVGVCEELEEQLVRHGGLHGVQGDMGGLDGVAAK